MNDPLSSLLLEPVSIEMRAGICILVAERSGALPLDAELLLLADWAFLHALASVYPPAAPRTPVHKAVTILGAWADGPLRVEARLLKTGRRLAVGEATIIAYDVIAHTSATYLMI